MPDSPPTPRLPGSATGSQPLDFGKSRSTRGGKNHGGILQVDQHEKVERVEKDKLGRWTLEWNALAVELDHVRLDMQNEHSPRDAVAAYAIVNSVALRLEQLIRRGNAPETSTVWVVAQDDVDGGYFTFLGRDGSGWDDRTVKATQFARRADADKASSACHVATHVIELKVETVRPCVAEGGR